MPVIELTTLVRAPRERLFDLSRSIDAHQESAKATQERAIAGVTTGLIGLNDLVTWEARHFAIRQKLTVRITRLDRPRHFQDVMESGAFKRMTHDHYFSDNATGTVMLDRVEFESPFGLLGRIADLFLTTYMRS